MRPVVAALILLALACGGESARKPGGDDAGAGGDAGSAGSSGDTSTGGMAGDTSTGGTAGDTELEPPPGARRVDAPSQNCPPGFYWVSIRGEGSSERVLTHDVQSDPARVPYASGTFSAGGPKINAHASAESGSERILVGNLAAMTYYVREDGTRIELPHATMSARRFAFPTPSKAVVEGEYEVACEACSPGPTLSGTYRLCFTLEGSPL